MAQGKPQLKFKRNVCNTFRNNRYHRRTDGRRTNFDFMSSADIVKQSYLYFLCISHVRVPFNWAPRKNTLC